MAGPEFFQTMMGKKFYESTAPRIARALEDISHELKRQNDLEEARREERRVKGPDEIAGEFVTGDFRDDGDRLPPG
jgi:hypothetical protein